jgi:hypothetical protein
MTLKPYTVPRHPHLSPRPDWTRLIVIVASFALGVLIAYLTR